MIITSKIIENIRDYYKCFQKSSLKNDKLKKDFVENWIKLLETLEKHHGDEVAIVNSLKQIYGFFRDDKLVDGAKAIQFQAGYDYFLFISSKFSNNK